MIGWIFAAIVFSGTALIGMGLAKVLKRRGAVWMILGAIFVGSCVGGFLAQAGSAMATSVHPRDALIKGALMGALMSGGMGGVLLAVFGMFKRLRKPQQ